MEQQSFEKRIAQLTTKKAFYPMFGEGKRLRALREMLEENERPCLIFTGCSGMKRYLVCFTRNRLLAIRKPFFKPMESKSIPLSAFSHFVEDGGIIYLHPQKYGDPILSFAIVEKKHLFDITWALKERVRTQAEYEEAIERALDEDELS